MAPARKVRKKPKRGPRRVTRINPPDREEKPREPPPQRPTRYTPELGEAILERLANGETATAICRDESMPKWSVLKRWERDNADFGRRYDIARRQCCEYRTDEIGTIVDDATNDFVDRVNAKGGVRRVFDREHFERARLRVQARQWEAQKVLRAVYGERSEVDLRTPDGLNVKVEERNALIDAICKLVSPKEDGKTKPSGRSEEARER